MTSVSIVSEVSDRIHHLLESLPENHSPSWRDDAENLRQGLESVKKLLEAADQDKKQGAPFVELENKIVQLTYDIDDSLGALEVVGFPSRTTTVTGIWKGNSERSSKADLETLGKDLVKIIGSLRKEYCFTPVVAEAEPYKNGQEKTDDSVPAIGSTDAAAVMEKKVSAALLQKRLRVVCIWGNSGMGKTTLAKKVFHNKDVRQKFQVFAWVSINDDFQTKLVLQDILLQLLPDEKVDMIRGMDEFDLTQKIFSVQKEKKCLVVLEDLWAVDIWRSIHVAFPPINQSNSKILITTPLKDVTETATSKEAVYEMRPLSQSDFLKILKEKAHFDDNELQSVGKTIFRLSGGSPLLALVLGRSLKTTNVDERNQLLGELKDYEHRNQSSVVETKVLELSYDRLPNEMKHCVLYMGQFPEGQTIQVEKLYLLLAAEDLVSKKTMDLGFEKYILEELANKMLVEVQEDKVSISRMYKSCCLHAQIRAFCISQGLNEEFFEIVDFKSGKKLSPSTRRLAIYLSNYSDGDAISNLQAAAVMKKIRSLLIFDSHGSEQKSLWPSEINDFREFVRLQVLDFDGVDFRVRKLPKGIDKVALLRYLSFRGCFLESFPSFFSKFQHLETLDLRTKCKMTIPDVIYNMKKLRHLFFPMVYESDGKHNKLQLHDLTMLEILVNFDTMVCKVSDLSGLNDIRILTIISQGNSKDLKVAIQCLDEKASSNKLQGSLDIRNFDCYMRERVVVFQKLLECKSLHSLRIEGEIGKLPNDILNYSISSNLTEMVFTGSEIEDDPMSVLGKLKNLRSLTLCDDAFIGSEMTIEVESVFPDLRILKLLNLQYLGKLTFKQGTMPQLSTLVIDKCDALETVSMPKELDSRLQVARGRRGDDVYLVKPLPILTDDN